MARKTKVEINLKSIRMDLNPNIPAPELRPRCEHPGCDRPKAIISTLKDGSPNYRKVCDRHHSQAICKKNGVPYTKKLTAERQGKTIAEYQNQYHKYRKYRKDYCENKDGSILDYKCAYTIRDMAQLQVDHINGDPSDNRPENLQTLCCMCHIIKTLRNGDGRTPGRKILGVK